MTQGFKIFVILIHCNDSYLINSVDNLTNMLDNIENVDNSMTSRLQMKILGKSLLRLKTYNIENGLSIYQIKD